MKYQELKAQIREKAIDWQLNFKCYSYEELAGYQAYFEKLGKRYGLLREFRENAIV